MSFYDEHTDDEDYVSDGELVVLENLTKIPWRDYESYLNAVADYETALEKRKRFEEKYAPKQVHSSSYYNQTLPLETQDTFDPLLAALQVYDDEGYDVDGFNSQGYDRDGFNRAGFNRYDGYDRGGYDIHGNSRLSGLSRFPKL